MFGVSFTEIAVIALVTLIVVGPQKLPSMLYTIGRWIRKLRQLTTEVRAQTGIDEILRNEGFQGGLGELRDMLRGDIQVGRAARRRHFDDPYEDAYEIDRSREYPPEGPDAAGALPDDLVDEDDERDDLPGAAADGAAAEVKPAPGAPGDAHDAPPGAGDSAPEPAGKTGTSVPEPKPSA